MNATQAMSLVAEVLGVQTLSATHQTFGHNSVTFDVALLERSVILRFQRCVMSLPQGSGYGYIGIGERAVLR